MTAPALLAVDVPDSPDAWTAAGFTVVDDSLRIGAVTVRLGRPVATTSWAFADLAPEVADIDGIATTSPEALSLEAEQTGAEGAASGHANGSIHLDHVVMLSPDLRRSVAALEALGFEVRRRRDIGKGREQVFLWTGPTIIELVGPTAPDEPSDEPAELWGLAVSTSDIDGAAEALGEHLGRVKDAVQQGRRIATVRTAELGITPTIALMTPHG